MAKENLYIAKLEKLMLHLKNAKLSYLKASDQANSSEKKRFFNHQATERNRIFQDILSKLQTLDADFSIQSIRNFNFDQLIISSIKTLKASALQKCLEADKALIAIYNEIEALGIEENFAAHIAKIELAIEKNAIHLENIAHKREFY